MNWRIINHAPATMQSFQLTEGNNVEATLTYNPMQNVIRLKTSGRQWLFFIEQKGFLNNKHIIKNEYGVQVGQLSFNRHQATDGHIDLDGEAFQYRIKEGSNPSLEIYERHNVTPLAVTGIQYANEHSSLSAQTLMTEYPFLVAGFCWFMLVSSDVTASLAAEMPAYASLEVAAN